MARVPEFAVALGLTGILLVGCGAPSPEGKAPDAPATAATTAPSKPVGMNRAQVAAARQEAEKRYDGFLKDAKSDEERKMLEEQRVKSRKMFDEFEKSATP